MKKICYVVTVWTGPRQSKYHSNVMDVDPFYFVKTHLEFLSKLKKGGDICEAIFVVNKNKTFIDKQIESLVNSFNLNIPTKVQIRPNTGFSYGAWNSAVKSTLDKNYDYYFLIEDDYIPTSPQFYKPFLKAMKPDIPYVCQFYYNNHAAISNGLLNASIAKKTWEKEGTIFKIVQPSQNKRAVGTDNQVTFLQTLEKVAGTQAIDINDIIRSPFWESKKEEIVIYGNINGPTVVQPQDIGFKFSLIQEEDLGFINKIRNGYASEFLHNSDSFSIEETIEWFNQTNPQYYIINYLGDKIGYFRLTNFSDSSKSVYIGADISPEFTGEGLGYKSYLEFIPFLFEKYNLNKINLEVLSTNERAIHLYKKLGFQVEGTKREEVLKNGRWVDSIMMSILHSEWNS